MPCYATVDEWKDLPLENFYYYKAGSNVTSSKAVIEYGGQKKYTMILRRAEVIVLING